MEREVTLSVDETIYEQFLASISLYKQVRVVSEGEARRSGRGGRPQRAGKPVVKETGTTPLAQQTTVSDDIDALADYTMTDDDDLLAMMTE